MWLGLGITGKRCPARSVERTDRAHVASVIICRVDGSGLSITELSSGVGAFASCRCLTGTRRRRKVTSGLPGRRGELGFGNGGVLEPNFYPLPGRNPGGGPPVGDILATH